MNVLDERALKAEIDEIKHRIDAIIKTVNQIHPLEPQENISDTDEQTELEHIAEPIPEY
jgi:hypothetical protein